MLLVSCGRASEGAALVHGYLFSTSLDFSGSAVVHGALPFRIEIEPVPQIAKGTGRGGRAAGLFIEIRSNLMPASHQAIGGEDGPQAPQAIVRWIPEGEGNPAAEYDGDDVHYSDGGFEAHAIDGSLDVELDGRAPGDGIRGRFELIFRNGERVRGSFASTFTD